MQEVFANLRADHLSNIHENHWVAKDNRRHLISWQNTALLDKEGRPHSIVSTGQDITQIRREVVLATGTKVVDGTHRDGRAAQRDFKWHSTVN